MAQKYRPRGKRDIRARHVFIRKNVLLIALLIFAFLSLATVVVTYYGQNAGNFIMRIDEEMFKKGITLSTTKDFYSSSPRLVTDSLKDVEPVDYWWLDIEGAEKANGNFKDSENPKYIAFTFYLKNNGEEAGNVMMNFNMVSDEGGVGEAVRVMIIDDGVMSIYQKKDTKDVNEYVQKEYPAWAQQKQFETWQEYYEYVMIADNRNKPHPKLKEFETNTLVTSRIIENFKPNDIKKYTIMIWIDGWDPEGNDDIMGGNIKFNMNFQII